MRKKSKFGIAQILIILTMTNLTYSQSTVTVTPLTEFSHTPQNKTVLEGDLVILRCKMREEVQNCQWFYIQSGLDIFSGENSPILVKEFRPERNIMDCSIKFKSVRLTQSGQWMCKALQLHKQRYVITNPAHLTVIPIDANVTHGRTDHRETDSDHTDETKTEIKTDGFLINTQIGETAELNCIANKQLDTCSWIKPDGVTLLFQNDEKPIYIKEGNYTAGNCSLLITKVAYKDEGNWKCVVTVEGINEEKFGPIIHLHVHEYGDHGQGIETISDDAIPHLPTILSIVSIVLIAIIIGLVYFMYKHLQKKNFWHQQLASRQSQVSDYDYGPAWAPQFRNKDNQLILRGGPNVDCRGSVMHSSYLDMTGSSGEGYIMFPASNTPLRSSISSNITSSTTMLGRSSDVSGMSNVRGSAKIRSTSSIQDRELPNPKAYDDAHLYEEIKYSNKPDIENQELNDLNGEDSEGYLVPKKCSMPNLTVIENNLEDPKHELEKEIDETFEKSIEKNSATSSKSSRTEINSDESKEKTKSSDIDNEIVPETPERFDSADGPLSSYDVPRKIPID